MRVWRHRWLRVAVTWWGFVLLHPLSSRVYAGPEDVQVMARLKNSYEEAIFRINARAVQAQEQTRKEYLVTLDEIETRLEEQGDLTGVLAVRTERERFLTSGQFPSELAAAVPEALRKAAASFSERNRLLDVEKVKRLAAAAQAQYQRLAELERRFRAEGNAAGVALARQEKDALLNDPQIREAIQKSMMVAGDAKPAEEVAPSQGAKAAPVVAAPLVPAQTSTNALAPTQPTYFIYKPGEEPPVSSKDSLVLRLNFPSAAAKAAGMNYTLSATLITARDRVRTRTEVHPLWNTKAEEGVLSYVPRITVTARNQPIGDGAKLVIEYFSRLVGESDRQKECVEVIPLPPLAVRQSVVVDARGIDLYKYSYRANWGGSGSRREAGRELYGLIIGVYAPDGTPLIQQVSRSGLESVVSSQMPAAKPCPPPAVMLP